MSYTLGSLVPLAITVQDGNGTATDATVVLTLTLPDGSTVTPSVTHGGTGVYYCDYLSAQAGRHPYHWAISGTVTATYADVFEVDAIADVPLLSLADAKRHLNQSSTVTTNDLELAAMLAAATEVVESELGRTLRQVTTTEHFDGGKTALRLRVRTCPCRACGPKTFLTVSAVVENGVTLSASDYIVNSDAGVLYRGGLAGFSSGGRNWFTTRPQGISVTYTVGYTETPRWARLAVLRSLEGLWTRSQQRPHPGVGQGMAPDFAAAQMQFTVPRAVAELITPHRGAGF